MKYRHLKEEIPALDIISSFEHRTPKRTPTSCDTTMASPHPAGRSSRGNSDSPKKNYSTETGKMNSRFSMEIISVNPYLDVSENRGLSQNGWFIMRNPIKMG